MSRRLFDPIPAAQRVGEDYEHLDVAGAVASRLESTQRADGWSAERQHDFLAAIAEGQTVEGACRLVGLSPSSAYKLRQSAKGSAFHLGWMAAQLLQRQKLADTLASRAFDGQIETITRDDGSKVERHRYDNRLAMALLTRLDRLAATPPEGDRHGEVEAARLVCGDWERYLALVAEDAGPARAALFLAARAPAAADPAAAAQALAPVVALARADLWQRTGAGDASELAVADLDPARRADWSAADWVRAEAAGLVQLAPPPPEPSTSVRFEPFGGLASQPLRTGFDATHRNREASAIRAGASLDFARDERVGGDRADAPDHAEPEETPGNPPLPQLFGDDPLEADGAVFWNDAAGEWRTSFPPPPGFAGDEEGDWGNKEYERTLADDEEVFFEQLARQNARVRARAEQRRQAWLAGLRARGAIPADELDGAMPRDGDARAEDAREPPLIATRPRLVLI